MQLLAVMMATAMMMMVLMLQMLLLSFQAIAVLLQRVVNGG